MSSKISGASNDVIIKNLIDLINGQNAHAGLDKALSNLTVDIAGAIPQNLPYSIWQLMEHIRIAQWDILEFSKNAEHKSPKWPDEYWPKERQPLNKAALTKSIDQIKSDRKEFLKLLEAPGADIYEPFSHGDGQNLLREALVLADHNSYHTGEIIIVRRLLNDWD